MKKPKPKKKRKRKTDPALIAEQQKLKDEIFEGVPAFLPPRESRPTTIGPTDSGLMQAEAPLNKLDLQIQVLRRTS